MAIKVTEAQLEKQLSDYISLRGWYVLKTDAGMISRRGPASRNILKGTIPKGFPDLVCVRQNCCLLIEVKTERGVISESQKIMHENLFSNFRTRVHVIRSLQEIQKILNALEGKSA